MREIEVKVRVESLDDVMRKLSGAGIEVGPANEQHDVVYCLPEMLGKENAPDANWLRIRTQNNTTVYFTLKRSAVEGSDLDSIEHETIVHDGEELATMLRYMGYVVYSDLIKIRRTAHVGDIELCLDEVPPLGVFLELEKLCAEDVDPTKVEAELLELVERLGITYKERMSKGYDVLMNEFLAIKE